MKEDKAKKRTIHIFLASSITDLNDDRQAIGDFINQLNNIYNSQNLYIHLHKCEDESENHSIINGGTQKSLNDEIRESDLCIVLFWHKAGEVTPGFFRGKAGSGGGKAAHSMHLLRSQLGGMYANFQQTADCTAAKNVAGTGGIDGADLGAFHIGAAVLVL